MAETPNPLQAFHTHLKAQHRSPNSIRCYLGDLHSFIAWFEKTSGEKFDPAGMVRRDAQEWREFLMKTCSPATVNRKLSMLRMFFEWAEKKGLTSSNPAGRVHGVRLKSTNPVIPSERTIEKVLQTARIQGSPRDRALLELLAATGLRVAEITALRFTNIELGEASAWLSVPEQKGCRPRRIPLTVRCRVALKDFIDSKKETSPDDPLFQKHNGKAITAYIVWFTVKKYSELAGIKGISPRGFRNAVAARLSQNPRVGLTTAAAFLGQSRLDVLANYFHPENLIDVLNGH